MLSPFNVISNKQRSRRGRIVTKIRSTTIREFGGGWNVIDAPAALSTKYASVLKNWFRKQDGSQAIRYGTKYIANVSAIVSGNILDIKYFNGQIIVVTVDGKIAAVDSDGVVTLIWDSAIAALLPGAPSGWSTDLEIVTFTEIKGSLVLCNGVDKPLEIQSSFVPRYLQDLATGSNVNTPIGKYCTTISDYLIISGVPSEPNVVYIAARSTVGVFPGDDAPNDSLAFDVGAYAPEENETIRGISSFRNFLFVHFFSSTIQVILGEYNTDADHVPRVGDTFAKFGAVGHRAIVPVINDLIFNDIAGVNTVKRNIISSAVDPDRISALIAPEYQRQIATVTQADMLTSVFAVYDRLNGHYMLFIPSEDGVRAFVFTFNERMKVKAWSEFVGWDWIAATSTALGRVFFARDTRLYQYGNEAYSAETYSADFIAEFDGSWANNTAYAVGDRIKDTVSTQVYIALIAHTSALAGTFEDDRETNETFWEEYEGEDINFDWEFPWTDVNSRAKLKRLANIGFDTQGTSQFNVDVFVDNIYLDQFQDYDPALTFGFTGGESLGYGGGDQPYGGGRRTSDERLWSHPVKFRIMKPRLYGSTKKPLRVVSAIFLFAEGKYGR
jgi:hypothetical protein